MMEQPLLHIESDNGNLDVFEDKSLATFSYLKKSNFKFVEKAIELNLLNTKGIYPHSYTAELFIFMERNL